MTSLGWSLNTGYTVYTLCSVKKGVLCIIKNYKPIQHAQCAQIVMGQTFALNVNSLHVTGLICLQIWWMIRQKEFIHPKLYNTLLNLSLYPTNPTFN